MLSESARSFRDCLAVAERLRSARLMRHESRVGRLSSAMASLMGLEAGHQVVVEHAASLHDIGKLALPDRILDKAQALDAAEWAAMRQHSAFGAEILGQFHDPFARLAAEVAQQHHECWDGSGYPDGLAGEAIGREARIVGLCDVYDALREERPYKPAFSHEAALRVILLGDPARRMSPHRFDPDLLAMMALHGEAFRAAFEAGGEPPG